MDKLTRSKIMISAGMATNIRRKRNAIIEQIYSATRAQKCDFK